MTIKYGKKKNTISTVVGSPGERKRSGLRQRANPETKICILDFHLGIKLENEALNPISSDKETYFSLLGRVSTAQTFTARYKEYTENASTKRQSNICHEHFLA